MPPISQRTFPREGFILYDCDNQVAAVLPQQAGSPHPRGPHLRRPRPSRWTARTGHAAPGPSRQAQPVSWPPPQQPRQKSKVPAGLASTGRVRDGHHSRGEGADRRRGAEPGLQGFCSGYLITVIRAKGAPAEPKYLMAAHVGALLHAAVLLGLDAASPPATNSQAACCSLPGKRFALGNITTSRSRTHRRKRCQTRPRTGWRSVRTGRSTGG